MVKKELSETEWEWDGPVGAIACAAACAWGKDCSLHWSIGLWTASMTSSHALLSSLFEVQRDITFTSLF